MEGGKAVEVRDVWKVYPDGTIALRGVNLSVDRGEIHGLLGENGAGKTTLMRIIYGEIKPTRGSIAIFGKPIKFRGPWDAMREGIAMVYQRFTLVPTLTVLENLYIAYSSVVRGARLNDAERLVNDVMERSGLTVPIHERVENLPVGIQQRVEILKALIRNSRILILDEPTSVLNPLEVRFLFNTLRKLKSMGITVIFITHKLREVKEITDRVTVLRKGRVVRVVRTKDVSERELARMMIGREVLLKIPKVELKTGEPVLRVENLWVKDDRGFDAVKGVSLSVNSYEILGIAGVQGNGQRELLEAIAGVRPAWRGRVLLNGKDITNLEPSERYGKGLSFIPEARDIGLVLDMNVCENSILTRIREVVGRAGFLSLGKVASLAREIVMRFAVVTPSISTPVRYLSGGNQQKLMVGRELIKKPKLLLVAEPTHGLDVAATEFVRKTILDFARSGGAVLLASTDLEEVMQLSSRVAVMSGGRVVALKRPYEYTAEELGLLMGGAVE